MNLLEVVQLPQITLAILNARVWTGNPAQPWATGIAVSGDRILSVGMSAEIAKLGKVVVDGASARMIDAKGAFVAPGSLDPAMRLIDDDTGFVVLGSLERGEPARFVMFDSDLIPGARVLMIVAGGKILFEA
mgnify:CR=1 FL=1